jgi:hypothetical protein
VIALTEMAGSPKELGLSHRMPFSWTLFEVSLLSTMLASPDIRLLLGGNSLRVATKSWYLLSFSLFLVKVPIIVYRSSHLYQLV